ncbi:MAG: DUF1579 domain-containing protein [Candidatus Moduliflexus flocculans]|nr:DUF1579 domain-containing protein [Candidatus Moduliflexus flocculans]
MILGGRYVRLTYKGEMMGQPFEGLQISGYDNITKAYHDLLDRQLLDQLLPPERDVRRGPRRPTRSRAAGPIRSAERPRSGWSSGSSRPDEYRFRDLYDAAGRQGLPGHGRTAASG